MGLIVQEKYSSAETLPGTWWMDLPGSEQSLAALVAHPSRV